MPADVKLIEAVSMHIDESSFTGESVPSHKTVEAVHESALLADRENMAYMTTIITKGRGKAIVTGTGMVTEIGKIAEVKSESGKAIVCVVGEGMRSSIGVAGRLFSRIAKEGINIEMISQGASEINVGLVVDGTMADKAVRALHDEFINGEK